jgi:hypothetical protein
MLSAMVPLKMVFAAKTNMRILASKDIAEEMLFCLIMYGIDVSLQVLLGGEWHITHCARQVLRVPAFMVI